MHSLWEAYFFSYFMHKQTKLKLKICPIFCVFLEGAIAKLCIKFVFTGSHYITQKERIILVSVVRTNFMLSNLTI